MNFLTSDSVSIDEAQKSKVGIVGGSRELQQPSNATNPALSNQNESMVINLNNSSFKSSHLSNSLERSKLA